MLMPRNELTKDLMKYEILKIKRDLDKHWVGGDYDPKWLAHQYLNKVLDKIEEYAR